MLRLVASFMVAVLFPTEHLVTPHLPWIITKTQSYIYNLALSGSLSLLRGIYVSMYLLLVHFWIIEKFCHSPMSWTLFAPYSFIYICALSAGFAVNHHFSLFDDADSSSSSTRITVCRVWTTGSTSGASSAIVDGGIRISAEAGWQDWHWTILAT